MYGGGMEIFMKTLRLAILVFVVICIFMAIHSIVMSNMGKTMSRISEKIEVSSTQDDWEAVDKLLLELTREWEKYSFWAALTIDTKDIEQLEISLAQAKAFAALEKKSDFLGEFIMFSKLVEHIPHREGFHIEEIL